MKSDKYIRDIRSLKEGATNSALMGVDAVLARLGELRKNHYTCLVSFRRELEKARATEPTLRNCMRFLFRNLSQRDSPGELKEKLEGGRAWLKANFGESKGRMDAYGSELIKKGDTLLLHCQSGTVTSIVKKAFREGKNPKVYSSETRPRFQGRETAKELALGGMEVTYIIDSASNFFMGDVDAVLVGADAIAGDGDLVNKIGTSLIALSARENNIPFYSCTHSFKLDLSGQEEPIEERDPKEVWERPPRRVSIRNPAFDRTPAKYITGYVTELGVLKPAEVLQKVLEEYPWMT